MEFEIKTDGMGEEVVRQLRFGAWETLADVQEELMDRLGPPANTLEWTVRAIGPNRSGMQIFVQTYAWVYTLEVESSDTIGWVLRRMEEVLQ